MPCYKCSNGKWKLGKSGKCMYKTKEDCEKAWNAYLYEKEKRGYK